MQKLTLAAVAALSGAVACAAPTGQESDLAHDVPSAGKADYGYEIVYGSYRNTSAAEVGELARLDLIAATDLPDGCEGRYTLTERTSDGEHDAAGCYHTYRYAEKLWIKFLDEQGGASATHVEKYSWVYLDETLVLRADGSDSEFFMELPLSGTDLRCTATRIYADDVFEEGLSTEEYPDVSVVRNLSSDRLTVDIGASSYDAADGADIEFAIADGRATATIALESGEKLTVSGPANGTGAGRVDILEGRTTRRVAALRCTGRTAEPAAHEVTCTMRRRPGMGGPDGEITATLPLDSEDGVQSNDGIAAYSANYSFDISASEGSMQVFFYENLHVQDETGDLACDLEGVAPGARFCEDTIDIDKNLGTEEEDSEDVTAFDFWCVLR